jgi:hypothetical protein
VITVNDLGVVWGSSYFNCSQDGILPNVQNWDATMAYNLSNGCYDLDCDIYYDIEMDNGSQPDLDKLVYYDNIPVPTLPKKGYQMDSRLTETRELALMYKAYNTNDILYFTVKQSNLKNINIAIYDISGKELKTRNLNLNGTYQTFDIDISNLNVGTYIYSIISNEVQYGTDKFIIVK